MTPLSDELKAHIAAATLPSKLVNNTMRVSENIEEICRKAKCQLSDRQVMAMRGALMIWLPKLADEANRDLLDAIDAVMKRHAR